MGAILVTLLGFQLAYASSSPQMPIFSPIEPVSVHEYTIPEMIEHSAEKYGVSFDILTNVISCESSYNSNAIGDYGESYGIAQIHLPDHPDITKEQALDADFSIDWMAQQFSLGHATMWSCFRKLYPLST